MVGFVVGDLVGVRVTGTGTGTGTGSVTGTGTGAGTVALDCTNSKLTDAVAKMLPPALVPL